MGVPLGYGSWRRHYRGGRAAHLRGLGLLIILGVTKNEKSTKNGIVDSHKNSRPFISSDFILPILSPLVYIGVRHNFPIRPFYWLVNFNQ